MTMFEKYEEPMNNMFIEYLRQNPGVRPSKVTVVDIMTWIQQLKKDRVDRTQLPDDEELSEEDLKQMRNDLFSLFSSFLTYVAKEVVMMGEK